MEGSNQGTLRSSVYEPLTNRTWRPPSEKITPQTDMMSATLPRHPPVSRPVAGVLRSSRLRYRVCHAKAKSCDVDDDTTSRVYKSSPLPFLGLVGCTTQFCNSHCGGDSTHSSATCTSLHPCAKGARDAKCSRASGNRMARDL